MLKVKNNIYAIILIIFFCAMMYIVSIFVVFFFNLPKNYVHTFKSEVILMLYQTKNAEMYLSCKKQR